MNQQIDKVVVNFCIGNEPAILKNCNLICLALFNNQKPAPTFSKTVSKQFGIKKGIQIGYKVTLRKDKAMFFLRKIFEAKENKIYKHTIGVNTFSIGLSNHLDLKILEYDPKLGIFGFDAHVSFRKMGSLSKRSKKTFVSPDEIMLFLNKNFNVKSI